MNDNPFDDLPVDEPPSHVGNDRINDPDDNDNDDEKEPIEEDDEE